MEDKWPQSVGTRESCFVSWCLVRPVQRWSPAHSACQPHVNWGYLSNPLTLTAQPCEIILGHFLLESQRNELLEESSGFLSFYFRSGVVIKD